MHGRIVCIHKQALIQCTWQHACKDGMVKIMLKCYIGEINIHQEFSPQVLLYDEFDLTLYSADLVVATCIVSGN